VLKHSKSWRFQGLFLAFNLLAIWSISAYLSQYEWIDMSVSALLGSYRYLYPPNAAVWPWNACFGLWRIGILAVWGYYLLDEQRITLRTAARALGTAVRQWVLEYPVWIVLIGSALFMDGTVVLFMRVVHSALLTIVPHVPLIPLVLLHAVTSLLFMVVTVWYASVLAVYYESIRFREEQ